MSQKKNLDADLFKPEKETGRSLLGLLLIIPHLLIGFILIRHTISTWNHYRVYEEQGQSIVAELIDRDASTSEWRGTTQETYQLIYRFSVNGQSYRRLETVDAEIYQRYRNTTHLNIIYLTSNPSDSILATNHTIQSPLIMSAFALLWISILLWFIYKVVRSLGWI